MLLDKLYWMLFIMNKLKNILILTALIFLFSCNENKIKSYEQNLETLKLLVDDINNYYESSDKAKGIHVFRYLETGQDDEEKSLFSRLKFWGDDEEELLYTLSVRSAGEKTEIFLLKKDGDFEVGKNVSDIFKELQIFYDSLKE